MALQLPTYTTASGITLSAAYVRIYQAAVSRTTPAVPGQVKFAMRTQLAVYPNKAASDAGKTPADFINLPGLNLEALPQAANTVAAAYDAIAALPAFAGCTQV